MLRGLCRFAFGAAFASDGALVGGHALVREVDDVLHEFFGIGGDWLPRMQVLDVKPPGRRDIDGRWARVWRDRLRTVENRDPWLVQFRAHPSKDDFWSGKDIAIDEIRTPTLAIGGWRDGYSVETIEFFEAIDAPKRLVFGPWRHVMPHRGREAAIDFRRQTVEWFDRFLKDRDNGATDVEGRGQRSRAGLPW